MAPTIYLKHISLQFLDPQQPELRLQRSKRLPKSLFNNFHLEIGGGLWTCILGSSGVGKSCLLKIIAHLIAYQGSVATNDGEPLTNRIAYMAQTDLLLPWLTILDNVLLGYRLRKRLSPTLRQQAITLLAETGLQEVTHCYPATLSGGMRQRAALVRTLLEDKPIVLMDEPFAAVDAITRARLQTLAAQLLVNKTVVLVTHDPLEALRLGHSIHVLKGTPARIGFSLMPAGFPPRQSTQAMLLQEQQQLLQALGEPQETSHA